MELSLVPVVINRTKFSLKLTRLFLFGNNSLFLNAGEKIHSVFINAK